MVLLSVPMKKVLLLVALFSSFSALAQFSTPSIDGVIETGEYGANNQATAGTGQTWYMTWDATNLYVAVTNANLGEGAVVYVGANLPAPPNAGTNLNGNLIGFNYDGEQIGTLPFRAQFVTYFKDGYREYRNSNGAGGWGTQVTYAGAYASSGTGNVRELSIPWSAITGGGMPASFAFLCLLTSSGGYVYGQLPPENPGAFVGTSAVFPNYYLVTSTANGSSTPPFSNDQAVSTTIDLASLKHDTFDPYYRSPAGAAPAGTSVVLRFRTAHNGATGVNLRVYLYNPATDTTNGPIDSPMTFLENRTENNVLYDEWTITYSLPTTPAIVYYKFEVLNGSDTAFYSDDYIDDYDNVNKDGTGKGSLSEPFDSFQVTTYDPAFITPAWMANANLYQIFPDRFRNGDPTNDYCVTGSTAGCPPLYGAVFGTQGGIMTHATWNEAIFDPYSTQYAGDFSNQFYGGDLKGVQDKLDYLQALGVDTLYLNPIFLASSNHRYDTDDYFQVDPALGGNAALTSLAQEMDRRGMRLILDGVFNHASSDSKYFNRYQRWTGGDPGACESLNSVYRTWFQFLDNNVPCTSADYTSWAGFDSLPVFVHTLPAVRDFFYRASTNVVENWYSQGASGWRFDVANELGHDWWHDFRPYAKTYKSDGPLIGEIWPNASQWLAGDQLDSVMNYRFRRNVLGFARGAYNWVDDNDNGNDAILALTPSQFDHAMRAIRDDYPAPSTAAMMNLIDSHDTNRALYVLTELGDTGLVQAKQRLELAALFQFTYLGAPQIYYGDEAALNSPSLYSSANGPVGDPYTRAPYPWTDASGNPDIYGPPDTSVIQFYTRLTHMRKQHPALRLGSFTPLLIGDTQAASTAANSYAFARTGAGETAIVALNNGSAANAAAIPVAGLFADGTQLQDALSGSNYSVNSGVVNVSLAPMSGVVLFVAPAVIDLVPPTGTISLSVTLNQGWTNVSPVTANVSGSDSGSGVSQLRYWVDNGPTLVTNGSSGSTTVSGEALHTVSLRVLDNAGNISGLITQGIGIDLTPPVVTVTGVANGAIYALGYVPQAGCNTSDTLSGVATNATLMVTGPSNGLGTFTATCSGAVDIAGNVAPSVSVTYQVNPPVNLKIVMAPVQGGTVTPAGGIYPQGVAVKLTATPNPGYTFTEWSGLASGTNPVTTVMLNNQQTTVVAEFAQ